MSKNKVTEAFVWPEFNSDSKRIKAYSQRYKNMTLTEAFAAVYNHPVPVVSEIVNVIPQPKAGGSFATMAYNTFENPIVVEKDKIFVMGDNRPNSKDSRSSSLGCRPPRIWAAH